MNKAKMKSYKTSPKYKYGFEVPKSYTDAVRLDGENHNTKWQDTVSLEFRKLDNHYTFHDKGHLDDGAKVLTEYTLIQIHIVFDVNHDGRHRARMIAGGHLTPIQQKVYMLGL